MTHPTNLTGKVALVQGGSRGIGAAIVKRLAEQGAAVAFTYISSEAKAREQYYVRRRQGTGHQGRQRQ
jgi:3-oxoacyl-[acyl-carrier protein] reductase